MRVIGCLLGVWLAFGCDGGGVGLDAGMDGEVGDAPGKDAPGKDAEMDGPPSDGPPSDGPLRDGPPEDAPKDAPPPDGPPDGPPMDAPPDAPPDGPPIDAPPDGPPDGPPMDAPPDAPPDGPPIDAPPPGPAVTSTATAGGFTQIHQGYESGLENFADRLTITGVDLADATGVMVGPLAGTIVSATATQLLVDVDIPHGFTPGPLTVTVTGPSWSATSPNPISVTHIIIGAGAPVGGRGTHQSPAGLCEPLVSYARIGDTLDLLAGTHMCNDAVGFQDSGMEIRGAGMGATIIAPGFHGFFAPTDGPTPRTTRLRDMTVLGPAGTVLIFEKAWAPTSTLIVERLEVVSGTAGAVAVYDFSGSGLGQVQISDVSYSGGGTALSFEQSSGSISQVTIEDCDIGIRHSHGEGALAVSATAIDDCATGIQLGHQGAPGFEPEPMLTMQTSHIDAESGALIDRGVLSLVGVPVTATASWGIRLLHGHVSLTAGTQIAAATSAVEVLGFSDSYVSMDATDADLIGGLTGLFFGSAEPTHLELRGTLVQGGAYGLRLNSDWGMVDLGTSASPGGNQLVGGTFAYDMSSNGFGTYYFVGTTLNGNSYAGQLLTGPSSLPPDYNIGFTLVETQL